MTPVELWKRYQEYLCAIPSIGLTLDISRMQFPDGFLQTMEPALQSAYGEMEELERGAIANPDEKRMVGHYWLRTPKLAPTAGIRDEITSTLAAIREFVRVVHAERRFTDVLCIGIGGSALGPMFVSEALGEPVLDPMHVQFIDNTDP